MRLRRFCLGVLSFGVAVAPAAANAQGPPAVAAVEVTAPDRWVEPVVLTGSQFPDLSAGPEVVVRHPSLATQDPAGSDCETYTNRWDPRDPGDHNCYQDPDVRLDAPREGVAVDRLRAWRWSAQRGRFTQIPFQVDERFTRYLSNNASGFAMYSGIDEHTDYAYDREGWRFTDSLPSDPCRATPYLDGVSEEPGPVTTPDPIAGLDDNDELVFMARDAGPQAPAAASPPGLQAFEVRLTDPSATTAASYVYVSVIDAAGPKARFTAANGYVRYIPDDDRDRMVYSQSSYANYGVAPKGPICDPNAVDDPATPDVDERYAPLRDANGNLVIAQRRPLDSGWVQTPTYRFRYEGRWMMTELHVADAAGRYGPDLIDRWKARAFAQDPSSRTPCCGYEEEDTNWGGSSILLGERVGPVRVIRATWGADSGTNVVRQEVFYRDLVDYNVWLRVHPIPPLDGIYTQWDYNAGRVDTYYNPANPEGVAVDGADDELVGNLDDPCNPRYATPYGEAYRRIPGACSGYHLSADLVDPTFSNPNATLQWEQLSGRWGTIVTRWKLKDLSVGGDVQGLVAAAYYRDNSCFDDGTGTNPGPKINLRSGDEPSTFTYPNGRAVQRTCWDPSQGIPAGDSDGRFYQGSIGVHGIHLLFVVDSDNAFVTKPVTEITAVQRQVILSGRRGNVGERYGRGLENPLLTTVSAR